MGLTCSRPISDLLEEGFLRVAETIDRLVRTSHKYVHATVNLCFSVLFGKDSARMQERLCLPGSGGDCLLPANTPLSRRRDEKRIRSERRKRAEAAALGRRVSRKRRCAAGRGYGRVVGADPDEQARLEQSLGEPVRAPPPRREAERETARERDRGKLWITGNVAASTSDRSAQAEPLHMEAETDRPARPQQVKASTPAPEMRQKKAPRLREGLPSIGEGHPLFFKDQREPHLRLASTERESGPTTHVDVIASSSDAPAAAGEEPKRKPAAADDEVAQRIAGERSASVGMKEVQPRLSSRVLSVQGNQIRVQAPERHPQKSGLHIKPQAYISKETSDPAVLGPAAPTTKKLAYTTAPTDVSGNDRLRLSAAPLSTAFEAPFAPTTKAKQELRRQKLRSSLDTKGTRTDSSGQVVDAAEEAPQKRRMRVAAGLTMRPRLSLDLLAAGPPSAGTAGSDAASVRSGVESLTSVRSPSPLYVAELADRACLSAQDASRKERQGWKDEVERLAVQKMKQRDAAARRGSGSAAGLAASCG